MRLDQLAAEAGLAGLGLLDGLFGDSTTEVRSVTSDSRTVQAGALFACVPGAHSDGHDFASAAVARGASALLCERDPGLGVAQVRVRSVRRALGPVADSFYGHPSRSMTVVGVTGTNGKTTTCALLASVFTAAGWAAQSFGTLTQARTTPEAPELQKRLADWLAEGVQAVAMEVSSHALDQGRADAVRFAAGVFTNLTQDHLDYHGTMDAYFEAKARLFEPGRVGVAVVNRDDPYGTRLLDRLQAVPPFGAVLPFGMDDAEDLTLDAAGSTFMWHGHPLRLHIGGRFNVANALAAATTAEALGIGIDAIQAGFDTLQHVPGRFQRVDAGQPFTVIVDYAHTPDGLSQALRSARELTERKLFVVFGAGGDRDHDKRPLMGAAAARLADVAIVTSDNPRSEDPGSIIEAVLSGVEDRSNVQIEEDRARAISHAVSIAEEGDVVVIAGKGHESRQEIKGRTVRFDDVEEARRALQRLMSSRSRTDWRPE